MKKLISYVNDWSAPCRETIKVALKKGSNTISLFGIINHAPYIDRIAVAKVAAEKLPVAEETPTPVPNENPAKPEETPAATETPTANIMEAPEESLPTDVSQKTTPSWIAAVLVILVVLIAAGVFFGIKRKKK